MLMHKLFSTILVVLSIMFSSSGQAIEFGDRQFPDTVTLPGTDAALQLNGIGYRKKFIIKVYIGALYVENRANSRDEVIAQSGPNRVLMHFVYDEVSGEKLVDAWNDGFESNMTSEQLKVLQERINMFNAMFTTVNENDVIMLDYVPGTGTRVTIKGDDKGVIPGEDFNKALLDIWLGDEPADSGLKDAMLGK
mgnify:FL=1